MAGITKEITGERFGKLVALYPTNRKSGGSRYWMCQCDCGNKKEIIKSLLMNGKTKSCGCMTHKWQAAKVTKHFGCMSCGSDKHYAKGYCRNCYEKIRRGAWAF